MRRDFADFVERHPLAPLVLGAAAALAVLIAALAFGEPA